MIGKARDLTYITAVTFLLLLSVGHLEAAPQSSWGLRVLKGLFFRTAAAETPQAKASEDKAGQPYFSKIFKDEMTFTLKGFVPSEADVKILQGVIAATSPGATLVDKSRVDDHVVQRDQWLAGMTFALRQLARLERGSASLNDNLFSLDGIAKTSENVKLIEQKLMEELPKGLVLQQVAVKPPLDQVPQWSAQLKPGSVTLFGFVPKDYDQTLLAYAKEAFREAQVSSTMSSSGDASAEWMEATKLALDLLRLLEQGNATVRDKIITVEGVFASPGMGALLKSFDRRLPKGFHIEANVREPADRAAGSRNELNLAIREAPLAPLP